MSDYTKTTDFASKDNLLSGNPLKLIKGTEINTEFDNIVTAISTKHDAADIGVTVQAYSANLDEYAAVNPTAAGLALLDDADAATQRATLGLVSGETPTVAALRLLSPANNLSYTVKGYYAPGDGGGGPLRIGVTGAPAGTYVDNGGSIIVPTGGDGSAAWLWEWSGDINVKWFGAVGDDITDDLAAFNLAITALQPWQTLYIPANEFRLSGTWVIENKYRTQIKCDGVLKPHGAHSDYLVKFTNSSHDPIMPSMGQNIRVYGLTLDCEWKCRGVMAEKLYDSSFIDLHIWRSYGHGLYTPMLQEVSFWKPMIAAAKPRAVASVAAAIAWDIATVYTGGEVVFRDYAAYAGGTTYAANDIVRDGGFLYRSTAGDNTGNATTSTTFWERIPDTYFVATALAGNVAKDPCDTTTDYTTRSGVAGDRYWTPTYQNEAAWEMVGDGANGTIDNVKVFNFISRSNATEVVLRVDSVSSSFPVVKCDFIASQIHIITGAYITAFNADAGLVAAYGGNVVLPDIPTLVELVSTSNFKFSGGQIQVGDSAFGRGLSVGTLGVSGKAAKTFLQGFYIEGTASGSQQTGISVLPSVETFGVNWFENGLVVTMAGTNCVKKIDPMGETELSQRGTATIVAGESTVNVVFNPPMAATPALRIYPSSSLRGLDLTVSGLTKNGFTLTVSGSYHSIQKIATLTATGGTNQSSSLAHNTGFMNSGIITGLSQGGDAGATWRLREGASTINTAILSSPAAPAGDVTVPWWAVWSGFTPVDLNFAWDAEIILELP